MSLGDKIRKYRQLKNLTQAQLGKMVGLTGDRIRQYENDVRRPKSEKLFEIAEALEINPTTLNDPDYTEPSSVMHTLFELEDLYGMHFERDGSDFKLVFSEGNDYLNAQFLKDYISYWIKKRESLKPDLNDSVENLSGKKKEYITWKARFPYDTLKDFNSIINPFFDFMEKAMKLLPQKRLQTTRFNQYFEKLNRLRSTNINYTVTVNPNDCTQAILKLPLTQLSALSDTDKTDLADIYMCYTDMRESGISFTEIPFEDDSGASYVLLTITSPQVYALHKAYMELDELKSSPIHDEDDYRMKYNDIMKLFNVKIEDYV